ncbi:microtubule cross-linking factor 2 isoform X2 [Dendropsophus ebraccatus]|uniref:microtubule cross-linking factor 2 isoform X2 n=1 Tax=Dendropsophus ebraccatus TaxID=150705 RepID=UPI003831CE8F
MEPAGPGGGAPPPVPEKKKLNRAPSPARPKDLTGWSLSKARRPSPVSLNVIPPGPRRSLPSPGTKKPAPPAARTGGKSKSPATPGTRRGTDSSSEGSCASEENSSSRGSSEEGGVSAASSRLPLSTSLAFSDLTEDLLDGGTESLLREMDELRSENDYLKDEIEELRSEMLEMRDVYMEEDVYQLQELRQQLEQVHKTCRILQYRLKKAERRGLRVAQTGQVDSELVSTLEQDVKVAKDVSVRLHNELEAVEKKRIKVEEENEELRQRLIETDLAKQVLQNEMDKLKENSLKRRRSGKLDKKPSPQEDNADLKCQLHFAKEESALMCKKLTKLAKENDTMKEELVQYRSVYGDLDSSLSVEEVANSPHSREAELKSHLKLVEEEANILSRRIVELEVENRGLRAEMDEMKVHADREHLGQDSRFAFQAGESGDNFVELRRHLQFVEEEADLLRRSMMELEDQNKLLMNELNKYKSDHDLDITLSEDSCSVISEPSQEELCTAKMQISELSGKVKKLQYENRVLLSNLQRYDLASCQTTKPLMETDAEAGDSAQCVPTSLWREGPIGGETDPAESKERAIKGILKSPDVCNNSPSRLPKIKDLESLFGIKAQVEIISRAIEVLTSDANGFPSGIKLCTDNDCGDLLLTEAFDNSEVTSDSKLVTAILSRLVVLQQELNCFTKKVDAFGESCKGQVDSLSLLPDATCPGTSKDSSRKENCSSLQQPECRNCREKEATRWEKTENDLNIDQTKGQKSYQPEDNDSYAAEIKDLQLVLSDANETIQGLQEQLSQERQLRKEDEDVFNQKIAQLKEDHQKLLLRREFELQSLGLQRRLEQKFWSQEKNVLVQEMQQFKQSFFLTFMKLKWFLQRWRKGKVLQSDGEDFLEVNSLKELYMLIEEEEINLPSCDGETWPQNMTIESMKTLSDVKKILKDLCNELQEERRGMNELQQQFARAKAAWEMERTELKLESGKHGADRNSPDIKAALKREREDHQHLLAESYSAVMDLTKQLQVSEKNWAQEKEEMLTRFQEERKQTEERTKELRNKVKQALNDKMQDKDIDCDIDASGTNLKRTKSVSSMSEFESLLDCSPFLPGQTPLDNTGNNNGMKGFLASQLLTNGSIDSDISQKHCPYINDKTLSEHLAKDNLGISSWDYTLGKSGHSGEAGYKQIQRSYTAPDRTGIRIYYSPPVVRRLEAPLVQNKEDKLMVEPGFLFTMAKPKDSEKPEKFSGNSYSRWLCSFSKKKHDLLDKDTAKENQSVPAFPSSLGDLEISGNMSDDMKEITNCVRQAIRSSSLERKNKSTSSQTVGLSTVGIQTVQMISIGLQTDLPRASLHAKSWSPRSSSLLSSRTKHISTSLDKVHSRIDRPCCSPKFGSPKLQRRSSSKLDASKDRSLWNLHQGKQNGSAWARSTTTRDSPVLSNIYDGSSSLFNVVDHAGSTESLYKTGVAERSKPEPPKYGIVQEFLRNVCGRSGPSSSSGTEKKELEDNHKRADNHDHCSSSVCHSSYNVSKLLSKKNPRQHNADEHRSSLSSQAAKDGSSKDHKEPDIVSTTATEDYSCNCNSHPVTSCFSRPSRTHSRQTQPRCQLHQEPAPSEEKPGSAGN